MSVPPLFNICIPVKSFDSGKEFLVVSAVDEDLCVVFDGLSEDRQGTRVEFLLLPLG